MQSPSSATTEPEQLKSTPNQMALVPANPANDGTILAEVEMGADPSAPIVRATVVQASTVFYDTPATLGPQYFSLLLSFLPFLFYIRYGKPHLLLVFVCVQRRLRGYWRRQRGMGPSL